MADENPSAPNASLEVPDYLEPPIGWRMWQVTDRHVPVFSSGRIAFIGQVASLISSERPTNTTIETWLLSAYETYWQPYRALEARHASNTKYKLIACPGSPCDSHKPYYHPACGIYAFKTREQLLDQLKNDWVWAGYGWSVGLSARYVIGQIALWGRIAEHEHGYRAQFAYPHKFVWAHGVDLKEMSDRYGVSMEVDESWKSETPCGESLQNHSNHQFPSALLSFPIVIWNPLPFQPSQREKDDERLKRLNLCPLSECNLLKQPKHKQIYQQMSLNLHRPIDWWFDKRCGLWLRTTEEDWEAYQQVTYGMTTGQLQRQLYLGGFRSGKSWHRYRQPIPQPASVSVRGPVI